MTLDFGIFDHLERRPDVPLDQQYEERLTLIAEADRIGRRSWGAYHRNFPKRGYEQVEAAAHPPTDGRAAGPSLGGDFDLARKVEAVVVGSPATVRAYVEQYAAESGTNYFVGAFQWGDLTHAEALRSLRLFANEVMPAIVPSPSSAMV